MGHTCLSIEFCESKSEEFSVPGFNNKNNTCCKFTMFTYFITTILISTIQNTVNCSSQLNTLGFTRLPIELNKEDLRELTLKLSPHLHLKNSTQQYWPILKPVWSKQKSEFRKSVDLKRSFPLNDEGQFQRTTEARYLRLKQPDEDNINTESIALIAAVLLIGFQAAVLNLNDQPPICKCGSIKLWHGNLTDGQNSQHLTDWYTFDHVINGFALYGALAVLAPDTPVSERFLMTVGFAVGWEVFENSPFIINRYRQTALAQGYRGDSIINSITDTLVTVIGFFLAHYLPVWASVFLVISEEVILAYAIRDNVLINIIQLVHPVPAISSWQLDNS